MRRAYAGLFLALWGCDPTRGLADTADAALPNQKRYFDGAGSLLVGGPWNRVVVDVDPDTLSHLGARRTDDEQPTFHLFGADAQNGCQVTSNAGTWLMGKPPGAPFRLLPFVDDLNERGRGKVRFTTVDCEVQDLVIEDGGRPSPGYERGFLVPTKQGYTFADPWSGESREIAAKLSRVLLWNDDVLFWADDELKSFSGQFELRSEWGNTPVAVFGLRSDYLVEDADGLHRVRLDDSAKIEAESVLEGACHLQHSGAASWDDEGVWVVLQQPCGNPRPTIVHLDPETFESIETIELPFEADAQYARAAMPNPRMPDEAKAVSVLFLTDVDTDELGTLWSWQADSDAPVKVAERARLDTANWTPLADNWAGSAHVNHQKIGDYEAYDWIRFAADGTTALIAEHVVRAASGDLLVNFDGTVGDLPHFDDYTYRVVAKAVPPNSGPLSAYGIDSQYARIDQFDGSSGRVLLGTEPTDPSTWAVLGEGVQPESPRFAWFMPALVFIEGWDADAKTGSLVAYNYDLDARTTIAEHVSSFDLTGYPLDGVVYTVPKGKQRGIWFSKAK